MWLICVLSVMVAIMFTKAQEQTDSTVNPKNKVQQPPWIQFNKIHVRCFCNLPRCVSTGYMCKSGRGACFSHLFNSTSSLFKSRHGCVELLTESRCTNLNRAGDRHARKNNSDSILMCCTTDLCNHVDNPSTRNLINTTLMGTDESDNKYYDEQRKNMLYSNSEVWFRAATIAVPICGAVILFVLIVLAVKILRNDYRNSLHHKLGSAMYVVESEQKYGNDNPQNGGYRHYLPKEYYPQAYKNAFQNQDDGRERFETSLLVPEELILHDKIKHFKSQANSSAKTNHNLTDL